MTEETAENGINGYRDEEGKFIAGAPGGPGRPPETPEQKAIKKATKELIREYTDKLAESLPLIEPKLIEKAVAGDIAAIKEVHDRVMGKPPQTTDITSGGEAIQPILVKFIDDKPEDNRDTE